MNKTIFSRNNIIRGLLFVVSVLIISYFLPRKDKFEYEYALGKPWGYSLLTAPFDIPINLDSLSIREQRDSINENFINVYVRDNAILNKELKELSAKLNAIPGKGIDKSRLVASIRQIYDSGIVDNVTYKKIVAGDLPEIKTLKDNVTNLIPTKGMVSVKVAYARLDSINSDVEMRNLMHATHLDQFLTPNIVIDSLTSNKLLNELYQRAFAPIGLLQKGERIIDRGDIVTAQTYTVLNTYQEMMNERHEGTDQKHYPIIGQILVVTILLGSIYVFLALFRWRFFNDMRKMTFLMLLMVTFTIFALLIAKHTVNGIFIIPFAMIPILLTIFFDSRTALYVHITEVFICTLVATFPLEFVFLQFVAGITAINSLKDLSKRGQLIRCAFFIFLAYSITYISLELIKEGNLQNINYKFFVFFAINTILLSFTYILVFVIEKIFGFISTVTLVELSDVNNPVLRELSEECPGTFQHSLQVSNLAAEAARKINANVQLVRTGALYHDIGKIDNPAFFTENQRGTNPHEHISPEQSAAIVIGHVRDGVKRADKMKLPQVIKDFIIQHHGRGKAKYFYTIACNNCDANNVDEALYTYPGSNPQSKETAIMMMADATEAASRSLKEHTDENIRELVDRIINGQIADGLLADSPLSFRDVETIKTTFVNRLRTIYHTRVSYPELKK